MSRMVWDMQPNKAAIPISTLQRSVRFSRIWLSSVVLPKECIQIHTHITIDYIVQTYIHHIDRINPTYTTIKVHSPLVPTRKKTNNQTKHTPSFPVNSFHSMHLATMVFCHLPQLLLYGPGSRYIECCHDGIWRGLKPTTTTTWFLDIHETEKTMTPTTRVLEHLGLFDYQVSH